MDKVALKYVNIEKRFDGAVWILSIDNPPANCLSIQVLDDMEVSFRLFQSDSIARVIILTGAGNRAFCAGADINVIASIQDAEKGEALAGKGQQLCDAIQGSDKPVIAAINGLCLGGGNEFAISCHLRVAANRAKFGQPEIAVGIIPGFGGTQRLSRLIGESAARRLILTGDSISATEAHRLGLVDEVVKNDLLIEYTLDLAKRMVRHSQAIIELSQRAIRVGNELSLSEGLKYEIECFKKVCETEDMKEGLRAFKEKRQPNYKHR